jgi:hypothetical protein
MRIGTVLGDFSWPALAEMLPDIHAIDPLR